MGVQRPEILGQVRQRKKLLALDVGAMLPCELELHPTLTMLSEVATSSTRLSMLVPYR